MNFSAGVAVPVVGSTAPAAVRSPLKFAEALESAPVALRLPVIVWLPLKELAPVVA